MCPALVYGGEQDRLGSCHSGIDHLMEERDHQKQVKDCLSSNGCNDGVIAVVWVGGSKTTSHTFPGTLVTIAVKLSQAAPFSVWSHFRRGGSGH